MAQFLLSELLRVTVQYTIAGNRLSCGLVYGCGTPLGAGSGHDLADGFHDNVMAAWFDVCATDCQFEQIYCSGVAPAVTNPGDHIYDGDAGTVAGESLPSNLPMIFQLRQHEEVSNHNGRIFISGIPEASVQAGLIDGGLMTTTMAALATALQTPIVAGGATYTLCVLQSFEDGSPITKRGNSVSQVVPTRAIRNQRRRQTEWRSLNA